MPTTIPTPIRESPDDILIVQNIDLNCTDVTDEIVTKQRQVFDPLINNGAGGYRNVEVKEVETYNHADFFMVKWGGHAHKIKPGEKRLMMRSLAKHYAKHLADHILLKLEKAEGKENLLNHDTERPKVLSQIILGVEDYYYEQDHPVLDEGERVAMEVDRINQPDEEKAIDIGKISDPMIGDLKEPEPIPTEAEINKVEPTEDDKTETGLKNQAKKEPTRQELMKELAKLKIPFEMTDTKDQLAAKLKSMA